MISHYCSECLTNWYPYQAKESCPTCGGGVQFRQEPASPEAVERYQATRPEWMARYFPERLQDTEAIDSLAIARWDGQADEIAALPEYTGERRFAA
jgi:uncharacterized Zn finger protein (UPF0148 family)